VTPEEMLEEAATRTAQRCVGRPVLAIQDTTVLRSQGGGGGGEYLHAILAVDAQDGAILGLIDGQFLTRAAGRRAARKSTPIEEKESFRWLHGADQAASVCAGAASVTVIGDRESDIFEAFALKPPEVELVVRVAHDRSLEDGRALFAAIEAAPVAGFAEMELAAAPGRKRRNAKLAARYMAVGLARPKTGRRAGLPKSVTVHLVDIRDVDPPPGEKAVHWRLVTTHAVSSVADAWAVADLYKRRWAIEQLFRTLKSQGFDIENLDIEDAAPRLRLIAAAVVAGVCVQQLVHARDGDGDGDGDGGGGGGGPGPRRRRRRTRTAAARHRCLRPRGRRAARSLLRHARGQNRAAEEPPSKRLARLRSLGLRPPRRMDRLLRQTRPHRPARRLARVPNHQTRRKPHPPRRQT
jgi:hypothetical protein